MTLKECLSFSSFEIVWQYMSALYPHYIELRDAYEFIYNEISSIETKKSEYSICIDKIETKTTSTSVEVPQWELFGVNGTRNKDILIEDGGVPVDHPHADRLVSYSVMHLSKAEWAGMEIDSFTVCETATIDISVQCLKKMMSIGFYDEIVDQNKTESLSSIEDSKYIETSDYIEITDGVFCHKDKIDSMKRLLALNEGESKA